MLYNKEHIIFIFPLSSQLIIIQLFTHHILESRVHYCQNPPSLNALSSCYVQHSGNLGDFILDFQAIA